MENMSRHKMSAKSRSLTDDNCNCKDGHLSEVEISTFTSIKLGLLEMTELIMR
jgi:hypothetical protein